MERDRVIYVKLKEITDNEMTEIDFDLQDEFGFSYETHDNFVIDYEGNYENYPIKIERLIDHLNSIKDNGATHVSIDYHVDHIGYIINGFDIRLMTTDEVNEYTNKHQEVKSIEEEYIEGMRKIKEEYQSKLNSLK